MERWRPDELTMLRHRFRKQFHGEALHTETGELLAVGSAEYERSDELLPAGLYEHYKSTDKDSRRYYVDAAYRRVGSRDIVVVYCRAEDTESGPVYARPLTMFLETLVIEGAAVPRFRFLSET